LESLAALLRGFFVPNPPDIPLFTLLKNFTEMKKFILHILLTYMASIAMGQTVAMDSSFSRDSSVTVRMFLPAGHKLSLIDLLQNNQRMVGLIARDTSRADTFSFVIPKRAPGTYTYQISSRRWTKDPCNMPRQKSNAVNVQVGAARCCRVPFTELTTPGPKQITVTWALCSSCSTYAVVYKQLGSNNPLIKPGFNEDVKGTGTRLPNYKPTITEAVAGTITRTYPTSLSGYWYQVDLVCNGSGCTSGTTFSNLIYTR
jgi:hypothetical protein